MITTPQPVLNKVSGRLNEKTPIYSSQRLGYFNQAMRQVVGYSKWGWAKKKHTLAVTVGVQEYNLTSVITDYNTSWGIDIVYLGGVQIFPVEYEDKGLYDSPRFTLSPDEKSIVFTKAIEGTEVIEIWYYQAHLEIDASDDTLNIPIPEDVERAVVLYMKHLVHDGKRQRNDARNAILDYQEVMEELVMQKASKKSKHSPKNIVNPLRFAGVRRNYANH